MEILHLSKILPTFWQKLFQKKSSENCQPNFLKNKKLKEQKKLNFKSKNLEKYNKLFTLKELRESVKKAHDTSAGPDDIHYQLLKHLPESCLSTLLDIFNKVWVTENFPDFWREAIVIPVPKPGKDHTDPINYRPIALTSCICQTMKRMINERLVWYLESNKLITKYQSGLRRQRGTTDNLIRFESLIREAFIKKNI